MMPMETGMIVDRNGGRHLHLTGPLQFGVVYTGSIREQQSLSIQLWNLGFTFEQHVTERH